MQIISLITKVDAEDIHISELKEFIGKTIEMIIREAPSALPDEKSDRSLGKVIEYECPD